MDVSVSAITSTSEGLQVPHGEVLVDLMAANEEKKSLIASTTHSIELTDRQACDVELLIVGWVDLGYHFMSEISLFCV